MMDIRLQVGDYILPLDGTAFGLREVPEWFSDLGRNHQWDEASGSWRGMYPVGVTQLPLTVVGKGAGFAAEWRRFTRAVAGNATNVEVIVTTKEGVRTLSARVRGMDVTWHPTPEVATFMEVGITLEEANPVWVGEPKTVTVTEGGFIPIPVAEGGVWPTVTITGRFDAAAVTLGKGDKPVRVPNRGGGLIFATDPGTAQVTTLLGVPVPGLVPFWEEPVRPPEAGITVTIEKPEQVQIRVQWIDEFRSAW